MFLCRQATISRPGTRPRLRWQTFVGCAVVALVCVACNGTSAPPPVGTPVTGAIQMLVTAKSVDQFGNPLRLTSYYPASASSATAVVLLGQLTGTQNLSVTWSRVTPTGPQVLFTKQVMATSYGRVDSTIDARGTLPVGTYEVSATVGGQTRTIEWAVYAPRGHSPAQVAGQLTAGPTVAHPQQPPPPASHLCAKAQIVAPMVSPTDVDVHVSAVCPETGENKVTRGIILGTMSKAGVRLVGTMHMQPGGVIAGNFRFNVCTLPAGSNVPGARLALRAIVYYRGETRDFTYLAGLPADMSQPSIRMHASVPPGTQVHPGEKIVLTVNATESTRLGTQIGIRDIHVGGPVGWVTSAHFQRGAGGCGLARGNRTFKTTYTVPAAAPKVIKLVGATSDWPGNVATTSISYQFVG